MARSHTCKMTQSHRHESAYVYRKFVPASPPSLISIVLVALLSLLATATATAASISSTHGDVVDLLHSVDRTRTKATAMMSPKANGREKWPDEKRNLGDIETVTATRQGRAFDVSLSPVSRHLDFGAISQLNDVMGELVIANLDLAPDTDIDFSTVLLAQNVATVNPGNVPVLTVRVLKTAYITIPSSEEDRIPTDESFDDAVEAMFADVQQKQELVYKLRETKNSAFASLWEVELAGFMTDEPTASPTNQPSSRPSAYPTATPSASPTAQPTPHPTEGPTKLPSQSPSSMPSLKPTPLPSASPTTSPSQRPTAFPTVSPTHSPTSAPTFGFASLTVEGNVFDISLTPMEAPLDFFSTTHLNNALSEMVRRNLVLDFKAKVKFTTVLLYQSIQIQPTGTKKQGEKSQEQPQPRWQYDNTRRLERNRALTHKTTAVASSTSSGAAASSATTLIARVRLTAHVSVPTIGGGKYNAHFIPDMDDMDNAISAVFSDPIQRRELLKKLQDSYDQFKSLTNVGFVEFIYPPTPSPSAMPSASPSDSPTVTHSQSPSLLPSDEPSNAPSVLPSDMPSRSPSNEPSTLPSWHPSHLPTGVPSSSPTVTDSEPPSNVPSTPPSLEPAVVDVRGNIIEISLSPVTQLLDFESIDTLDAVLDELVGDNLVAIVPEMDKDSVSFSTNLIGQHIVKGVTSTLKVRVSRVAHFRVPAKAPGIPVDSAVVSTGGGIDLATQIVFTDVFQRASLIESLRSIALNEDADGSISNLDADAIGGTGSNNVFQRLREVTFEQFVYPPTPEPTGEPSVRPSARPSSTPSYAPTKTPSSSPSWAPTFSPSSAPSSSPTPLHSASPSSTPSGSPSHVPTMLPTASPSSIPSVPPTKAPTRKPSLSPTQAPTMHPTTAHPSATPSMHPTTEAPTFSPSATPTTAPPTREPTASPSQAPSTSPTDKPTYLPVTLDIPLSDFTLLFSPMDSYLAQGARDELNTILDQMIIDNLILSEDLGPVKIEFSTTVLSQLTSEDEEEASAKKGGKRRRIQQRKPDPYLSIAFRKVAHVTVQTLDIFGNINEEAVPDSASFDLAVLTIFTDLTEKERFVLSLIDSIARFANLRNVIMKGSVSSRMLPPPAISSRSGGGGSGDDIASNSSNQIVPGVSNSMFYGIVATVSIIICAVGLASGKMILSKRNEDRGVAGFGGGGKKKRKVQLGEIRSKGSSGRPRSGPRNGNADRHSRSRSRPQGQPHRSRERPSHHLHHHRHHPHHPPMAQEYNHHHLQQAPQQYYQQQEAWGAAANYGMTMEDESDSVSELEVGESVVANMMSMKEQDGGYGKSAAYSYGDAGGVQSHHHAPRRTAYASVGDYDGWNNRETTWDRVDAT